MNVRRSLVGASLLLLAGCASLSERVDREVHREIGRAAQREPVLTTNVLDDAQGRLEPGIPTVATPVAINRTNALLLAARHSRSLQDRRDALYGQALTLFAARRGFEMQYSGTADYVFRRDDQGEQSREASARLGATRILPTGGTITFTGQGSRSDDDGSTNASYASSAAVRLDQPLLAGAGREASWSPLIQAERNFIYALRDFALDRQDFAIEILSSYYDLVRAQTGVSNLLLNVQQFTYLRERSEALFQVRRAPAIDVLRAQQEELTATNRLTGADEQYRIQVQRFLVQLGLPGSLPNTVADDVPEMRPVPEHLEQARELALENRPDVRTVRDRVEDAERALRVARNAYRVELNAFGEGSTSGRGGSASDQDFQEELQAGVALEIPLDRRDRRDAVRLATLVLEQARRTWEEKRENVALEVAESYSRLRTLAQTVEIQRKNQDIAVRRAENANFLFRTGELSNRDVVEAQNDLLNARNALVSALLDYDIQRLQLLRNVGLLDVGPEGELIELAPAKPAGGRP